MEKIKVAIVEDDLEVRQSLSLLINSNEEFSCEHAFANGEKAVASLKTSEVDVVLLDIQLPGISGIEVLVHLKMHLPQTDFLMLTVMSDDKSVFDSLCAGASGYLLKDMDSADILRSIKEVHSGGAPMNKSIARKVIGSFRNEPKKSPLSPRETEILELMCSGYNYKTAASSLYISSHTVKTHIKNIYTKLHVTTRAEAVSKAIRNQLI